MKARIKGFEGLKVRVQLGDGTEDVLTLRVGDNIDLPAGRARAGRSEQTTPSADKSATAGKATSEAGIVTSLRNAWGTFRRAKGEPLAACKHSEPDA